MRLTTSHLSGALPLLALVSAVSGLPAVLVDPVRVDVQGTGPDMAGSGPDLRLASLRKELVPADGPDTPTIGRRGKRLDDDQDTHVSLINATPYRWHLTFNSSYQLRDWDSAWPAYVVPGASVTVRARNRGHGVGKSASDSAGEVTYELEHTRQPA
ncbi:hypothetical protein E4U42_004892, partial [Claviceps africana]